MRGEVTTCKKTWPEGAGSAPARTALVGPQHQHVRRDVGVGHPAGAVGQDGGVGQRVEVLQSGAAVGGRQRAGGRRRQFLHQSSIGEPHFAIIGDIDSCCHVFRP